MSDWTQAYARAAGIKWTPAVGARLQQWQKWEGGATHNDASNNYMNSTLRMPGSRPINGVGVQAYASLAQGARSFGKTLAGRPEYQGIKEWLATGQGDPSPGLQTWVSGHPTGNPGYAAKVIGGHTTYHDDGQTTPHGPAAPSSFGDFGIAPTAGAQAADQASAIRQHAIQGFGDIAMGKSATDTFGDMSSFIHSLPKTTALPGGVTLHPATLAAAHVDETTAKAVSLVQKYLGVKYTWGGTTAAGGFDCSGLIQTVWHQLGVNVPRTSEQQWKFGRAVDLAHLKPGDAVFTEMRADGPGHVGMYIGNGKIIAAPHTGTVVQVQDLSDWNVAGARRFA